MVRLDRTLVLVVLAASVAGCASSSGIHIAPTLGAFRPGDRIDTVSGEELEMDNSLALGLNVEGGPVRGTLLYATGGTISRRGVSVNDIGDGSLLALTGDVVVRPIPRVVVQPYGLLGAGLKRQTFSIEDASFDELFPEDRTEFAFHIGLGADAMFGRMGILLEISDFIATDDSPFGRHDTFVTTGIRVRMR
jgi:hypothetical protein